MPYLVENPNTDPEVIKLLSCSTQLSTTFILFINAICQQSVATIGGILLFIFMLNTPSTRLKARKIFIFQCLVFMIS